MSVTTEALDALKAAHGNASDYRAAKLLGIPQQTMSKYRANGVPISAEKLIKACELAEQNAAKWLILLRIERAKCDKEKALWHDVLMRLGF